MSTSGEDVVIAETRRWLERAVIGLNLCPFAPQPYRLGRVHIAVSAAHDTDALVEDLCAQIDHLLETDAAVCETTLLVLPHALQDFDDFNDFLGAADAIVEALGMDGMFQIASFHPQYRFEGSGSDDIENHTNRSPHPILHLLREDSVSRAVAAMSDPDAIYRRNVQTLRDLGHAGWLALWRD
jgi:hypothetical protein